MLKKYQKLHLFQLLSVSFYDSLVCKNSFLIVAENKFAHV